MIGRRRPDTPHGDLPAEIHAGDYWKVLTRDGSAPREITEHASNLTGQHWMVAVPWSDEGFGPYGLGNLEAHTVREEDDGTISVRRNDGSSNSILIGSRNERCWHGYIDHGVFERLPDSTT
ncbi:MAG TPA: hypothetical protein VH063_18890 [Gaiellaceae bacterium]|jgi:hypothetical protein|nr:hypothetical protein [Gaiellaceae bacterium]